MGMVGEMKLIQEIRWVLTGQYPETIAMSRLAEYMTQLSSLLGEDSHVHFERLERGSVAVVATIDRGAPLHAVQQRLHRVKVGTAPAELKRVYDRLNAMVGADGGKAHIKLGTATVLYFPGTQTVLEQPLVVHEHGTLTGKLYAMSESANGSVTARIRPRIGTTYIPCTVEPSVARELRGYFGDAVRVNGRGVWERSASGAWVCTSFHVKQVRGVKNVSLRQAITALRAIDAEWPDDPLGLWADFNEQGGAA